MPCYIAVIEIVSFKQKGLKWLVILSYYAAPFIRNRSHAQESFDGLQKVLCLRGGGIGNPVHYLHQARRLMFFHECIPGLRIHKGSF
mgnify:CR=1 FL=1